MRNPGGVFILNVPIETAAFKPGVVWRAVYHCNRCSDASKHRSQQCFRNLLSAEKLCTFLDVWQAPGKKLFEEQGLPEHDEKYLTRFFDHYFISFSMIFRFDSEAKQPCPFRTGRHAVFLWIWHNVGRFWRPCHCALRWPERCRKKEIKWKPKDFRIGIIITITTTTTTIIIIIIVISF